ncbi:hypothetical protein DFH11DRAFT_1593183 [Phellopilus nigrolimitatus]|nr:hypothetical protein DFH11DRAFT_1593183 [Phellopilus nigrolimitatus]
MVDATPHLGQPVTMLSSNSLETLVWDAETLYTDLNSESSTVESESLRQIILRSRSSSTMSDLTVNSTSNSTTLPSAHATHKLPTRLAGTKDIIFKSLAFITVLPRISSARRELAMVQRGSLPSPLYRQKKVLDDLLDLSKDELPYQMRRSALRLLQISFQYLVQEIFIGSTRRQFLNSLKELCSDELPYAVRKEGFVHFYYMVAAGASLENKSFALEHEDCRVILQLFRNAEQVSLKLAASAYLWLACKTFRDHLYSPISETEHREICLFLADLTQNPYPISTRRDALDWLWRLEDTSAGLSYVCVQSFIKFSLSAYDHMSKSTRHEVWSSILEISGYTELNALLLYCHADAFNDCLAGIRRLWWFSLIGSWTLDMRNDLENKKKVGADLLSIVDPRHSFDTRRAAFELIALFSNLPHWHDMFDETTWRLISKQFANFCLYVLNFSSTLSYRQLKALFRRRDIERVNKEDVIRRVVSLLADSTADKGKVVTTRKELQLSKRVSVVISREQTQIAAVADSVRQNFSPDTTIEAALENLAVFTLPGESLLIQKDQQAILYDRICNYAKFHQTRLIAVQAMLSLMTIQEWLSGILFAKGPTDESETLCILQFRTTDSVLVLSDYGQCNERKKKSH